MGFSLPDVAAISGHKDRRMLANYTQVSTRIFLREFDRSNSHRGFVLEG